MTVTGHSAQAIDSNKNHMNQNAKIFFPNPSVGCNLVNGLDLKVLMLVAA